MSNTIDMTAGSTFASLTASTTNVIVETVSVDDDTVWTPAAIGGIVGAGVLLLMFLCVALIATCIVTRRRLARANAQVADSVRQRESEQISSASHEYGIIATSQTNYVDHAIKPLDRSPYDELRAHEATSDLPTVNHSDL